MCIRDRFNINEAKIEFSNEVLNYEVISGTGQGAVLIMPVLENNLSLIHI